jgi:hypothetical protein
MAEFLFRNSLRGVTSPRLYHMKLQYHLAQVNIGKILAPMDSSLMSEFKNNLDRINALAEASAEEAILQIQNMNDTA